MKFSISKKSASALGIVTGAARAFVCVEIDGAYLMSAGWICVLLGGLLALPIAYFAERAQSKIIRILAAVFAAYETAALARLLINTTSYSELSTVSSFWLTMIISLLIAFVLRFNGAGVAGAARLWLLILPILFGVVAISEYDILNFNWLFPVFAPGEEAIITGSLRAVGALLLPSMLFMASEGEKPRCVKSTVIAALIAAGFALYRSVVAPSLIDVDAGRTQQLDILLSNGRAAISLQFPMMVLWYISLIVALCGCAFAAAANFQNVLPNLSAAVCGAAVIALVWIFSFLSLAEGYVTGFAAIIEYIALGFVALGEVAVKKCAVSRLF